MGNKISRGREATKREMEEWRAKEFERQNGRRKSSTTPNPSPTKKYRPNHRDSDFKSDLFFSTSEGDQLDQLEVIEGFNLASVDPEALAHIVTQTRELNEQNRRVTKKKDVFISFLEKKKTRNVVSVDWSGSKLYALDPEALEQSIDHLQEVEQRRIILPNKQVLLAVTDRVQVSRMQVGSDQLISLSLLRQTSVLFNNKPRNLSNRDGSQKTALTFTQSDEFINPDPKICPFGLICVPGDLTKRNQDGVLEDQWEIVEKPEDDIWHLASQDLDAFDDSDGCEDDDQPTINTGKFAHPLAENVSPVQEKRCNSPVPDARPVVLGHPKKKSKLKFDVVTAKVVEEEEGEGRKHVAYTIVMKRAVGEARPVVITRRYNEFAALYSLLADTFDPIDDLGKFCFPKKVLMGNLEAQTVTERTDAFHKLLNLIAASDRLLYSECFQRFLAKTELSEAVSNIKLGKLKEAAGLLETIFYIREKLLTISHFTVFDTVMELVACLVAAHEDEEAFRYALVANLSLQQMAGQHNRVARLKVPFLKLTTSLAIALGRDAKPYSRQLSEMRSLGLKTDGTESLLEVVREKYMYTSTHTLAPGNQPTSRLRVLEKSIHFVCKDI